MRIRTFEQFLTWLDFTYEDPYFQLPEIPTGWFAVTKRRQAKMREEEELKKNAKVQKKTNNC